MKLAFGLLKKIIPELNVEVITVSRILSVLFIRNISIHELVMPDDGVYVTNAGKEYVFLRYSLQGLLKQEVLLHESCHALIHSPAPFLLWRQQLQADVFALIGMMPLTDLKRLNRAKHQLDSESYELLLKRNQVNQVWQL